MRTGRPDGLGLAGSGRAPGTRWFVPRPSIGPVRGPDGRRPPRRPDVLEAAIAPARAHVEGASGAGIDQQVDVAVELGLDGRAERPSSSSSTGRPPRWGACPKRQRPGPRPGLSARSPRLRPPPGRARQRGAVRRKSGPGGTPGSAGPAGAVGAAACGGRVDAAGRVDAPEGRTRSGRRGRSEPPKPGARPGPWLRPARARRQRLPRRGAEWRVRGRAGSDPSGDDARDAVSGRSPAGTGQGRRRWPPVRCPRRRPATPARVRSACRRRPSGGRRRPSCPASPGAAPRR